MDVKFSVKELSEITGISSRTIRYYDDIKLLKSSGNLENGYRYYNIDKVEEIGIINYLRHMGVPIKEIKKQMQNRNIDEYSSMLDTQLDRVNSEILKLERIKYTIEKRIASLAFIRNLPPIGQINICSLQNRRIIRLDRELKSQIDWELALKDLDKNNDILPSIFIGELGFFVNLEKINSRAGEEFSGIFLLADHPIYDSSKDTSNIEAADFLSIYINGDHNDASNYYELLLKYAKSKNIKLKDFALERTLIDHYISDNDEHHITEILIPIDNI